MLEIGDEPDGSKDINKEDSSVNQEAEGGEQAEESTESEPSHEAVAAAETATVCFDHAKEITGDEIQNGTAFNEELPQEAGAVQETTTVQEAELQEAEVAGDHAQEVNRLNNEDEPTAEEETVEDNGQLESDMHENEGEVHESTLQVEEESAACEQDTKIPESCDELPENSEEVMENQPEAQPIENTDQLEEDSEEEIDVEYTDPTEESHFTTEEPLANHQEEVTGGVEEENIDVGQEVGLDQVVEGEDHTATAVPNETEPVEEDQELNGAEEDSYLEHESMEVNQSNHTELHSEDKLNGDAVEDEKLEDLDVDSVPSDVKSLPQCRLKRNYSCNHCGFNTQNPREHLYHLRDEHGEKMKIFECPRCIYASKNHQKLIRHARMVHKLKIKSMESSTSPSKKYAKVPRAKVSPSKSRESVSPSKSSRSSPGKSPRSGDGTDAWDEEEEEDYFEDEESPVKDEGKTYHCQQCEFTCRSRKLLNKHETTFHLKRRFFRCVKCNYVTHLKGRYTKHMKYHQLPILKCDFCDFRTPYRWNLDRHMKNHTEDCGEYKCHLCNFTAQIKQSLTVHISNHHLTPEQIRERELKRTIGISDPADCTSDDKELEMMRLERDEHPDALRLPAEFDYPDSPSAQDTHHNGNSFRVVSNIDTGGTEDSLMNAEDSKDEDGEPKPKKPKIKITLKKMKEPKQQKDTFFQELNERHNFEEDFIHPDDVVHRHGNVYIKTFKCQHCPFKAAFQNEVTRHERKIHSLSVSKVDSHSKKSKKASKSSKSPRERPDTIQQILQYPQSLDDYDSKSSRDSSERSSPIDRRDIEVRDKVLTRSSSYSSTNEHNQKSVDDSDSQTASSKESSPSKEVGRKKHSSSSFFDKLQEKISTSNVQNLVCQFCGHESKCLSESVRHQKLHLSAKNIYASASLSTRCQFCRHRCKTTDDLVNHLKLCPEARKNQILDSGKRIGGGRVEGDDEASETYQDEEADEVSPDNEGESTNEDSKDGDTQVSLADNKHPMENRVFVWNKIRNQEEKKAAAAAAASTVEEKKQKVEGEESDEEKDSKSDIAEVPSKESSKSPVMMDYVVDFIESPTPQGQYRYSKRVFRCPQCSFWATTASRFHVHVVGHYNKKPYNCSECGYKSNWRWDITKHIKLKTTRDNSHQNADVVITDATGEKNYEKYDRYLTIIQVEEANAHRTEGGVPNKKGRPKRTPDKDEEPEPDTPTTSPVRKPPMVTIPVVPRLPGLPRLTRPTLSRPGPMPFGPILPGPQMMVQLAGSIATTATLTTTITTSTNNSSTSSRPPPLLSLRGSNPIKVTSSITTPSASNASSSKIADSLNNNTTSTKAQYQIITPQGAVNTSLETLQLLASGSTNLSRLKKLQKDCVVRVEEKEPQNPNSHQVSVSSTGEDGREVAKMVLDHEGNPEWKCNSCDFRDSERETVVQHVRLAHERGGPVSLLHAVHRCDVCGYAAGTKRAVQLHIDTSHGGQGGITSRCEGQTPAPKDSGDGDGADHHESPRTMKCRICPYTCRKRSEMRAHIVYHTARPDCIFKCMFCPYYVPTKLELFEHLSLHGMEVPASVMEAVKPGNANISPAPTSQDDGSRQFLCGACPFETRSRSKLMHHRQFHKPKGLPFKCPHCTYNVTRRHLLSQHIRVHGVDPGPDDGLEATDNTVDDRSNSPSPSLTITPVNNVATVGEKGQESTFTDASALPKLTDQTTMLLDDIPLVWVSRDNRFFKMFKCRHCPHVNLRKTNIQEHEKMHKSDAAREAGGLHCTHCSYISVNAGVMSAHLKVHGGSMGQCHAIVDPALSDEEQLRLLTSKATTVPSVPSTPVIKEEAHAVQTDEKLLYFCQQCPARFFFEKEIQIHTRFHLATLPHHCEHCSFGGRQEAHLLAHAKVHSPEYQQRTRTMMAQHRAAVTHPPVPGLSLPVEALSDNTSLVQTNAEVSRKRPYVASPPPSVSMMPQPPPTSKYMCDQCPASFSKFLTLQYHQSLHGANNPYHCERCSYAGKTMDNLKQHQLLHDQHDESLKSESGAKDAAAKEALAKVEAANAAAAAAAAAAATAKTTVASANISAVHSKKVEKYRVENNSKPQKHSEHNKDGSVHYPPIRLKLIGLRPVSSENGSGGRAQFKYYVEEQVPLSGVDLLRRKTEMEKEGLKKSEEAPHSSQKSSSKSKSSKEKEDSDTESHPMRIGDRSLHYPLHIDKVTGRSREKRYKCNKCPSAFEKTEQYHVHINLHGSNHKYRCQICDYSVKFYANFMMHINRHKYHEKMVAQKTGSAPPSDDDPKYLPSSEDNSQENNVVDNSKVSKNKVEDKENVDDRDLTTTERQHLLLQNKKGIDCTKKDADKERQVYYCIYCPYANIRRDAVDSHSYRHLANGGFGVYKCTLCDYTASQLNFIKEHTKVHFRPFKYVSPEGFMRHDKQSILSTPTIAPGTRMSAENSQQLLKETHLIFSHDSGVYKPDPVHDVDEALNIESAVKVHYRSGDVMDAPNEFVIAIRPTKSKGSQKLPQVGDALIANTAASSKISTDGSLAATQCVIESTKMPEPEEMDEEENKVDPTSSGSVSEEKEEEEVNLTNGHAASDAFKAAAEDGQEAMETEEVGESNGKELALEDSNMELDLESVVDLPKVPIAKPWGTEQPESLVSSH